MPRIASLTLGLVLLAGCGGSIPLEDLPSKEAHSACDALARCFGPAVATIAGNNCVDYFTHTLQNGSFAAVNAEVTAGRTVYHGDQAQSCIDAIAGAQCSALDQLQTIPACQGIFVGTIAVGGTCSSDLDCDSASYCDQSTSCSGSCTARVAAGHACMTGSACVAGLDCDSGICVAPATEGQPCGGPSAPNCTFGLTCDGATGTAPGTCITILSQYTAAAGAACDPTHGRYCMGDLSCAAQTLTSYVCESGVAAGAVCKLAFPDECPDDQYCAMTPGTATGTCTALPAEGQPCAASLSAACVGSLACIGRTATSPGTCRARLDNGGACTDNAQCWSNTCTAGSCAAPMCHI